MVAVGVPNSSGKLRIAHRSPAKILGIFSTTKYRIVALTLIMACVISCEVKRPPGFLNIGKVAEVGLHSHFMPDKSFYLIRDDRGLAIMSTLCSYDRLPLKLVRENEQDIFVSDYNPSRYDLAGHVIAGPAKHDLLFYSMRFEPGVYGGAKDSLYVKIGTEVSRDWRLKIE